MKTKILADFQICISVPLSKETNDNTDVFTEGIESPCCASIPYDCLKTLESKVNEIYELSSSTKDAQIKDARQLEKVTESIMFINEKFEEYEVDIKEKQIWHPWKKNWQNLRLSKPVFKKELSFGTLSGWNE